MFKHLSTLIYALLATLNLKKEKDKLWQTKL